MVSSPDVKDPKGLLPNPELCYLIHRMSPDHSKQFLAPQFRAIRRTGLVALLAFVLVCLRTWSAEPTPQSQSLAAAGETNSIPPSETYRQLAAEIEANLKDQILAKWYPRAVDDQGGGFFQNYNEDWSPGITGSKAVVYESRLTWTAAQAAMRFPEQAAMYSAAARQGLDFLAQKMWDQTNGGFFWSVDDHGIPTGGQGGGDGGSKQEYGNGFAVFAAAAVYQLTRDPAALALAKKGFLWYDEHGHDATHGGYYEILTAAGQPDATATPAVGGVWNGKTMNSSIHMLEALTSLYQVWPDARVKLRLREMIDLLCNTVAADPGYLIQFFRADWQPLPGDDSYGHDVETSYLLVEAATALGIPADEQTWSTARKLVDHALSVGWDPARAGMYDSGGIGGGHYSAVRDWWVEAEMLNALLLMHEHLGRSQPQYWQAFLGQWKWIKQYGIDPVHGGWWPRVNNDGSPVHGGKSDAWTECYHQGRALLNVSARLRRLAEEANSNYSH